MGGEWTSYFTRCEGNVDPEMQALTHTHTHTRTHTHTTLLVRISSDG